jgi:hypothetical protein
VSGQLVLATEAAEVFLSLFPAARVEREPIEDILARYAAVVSVTERIDAWPRVSAAARVALLVREFDVIQHLLSQDIECDIVFHPSALALLDFTRRSRLTVVATRDLAAGVILKDDDLGIERGGRGIGAERKSVMVGTKLVYALAAGDPVDFGMIEPC